MKAHSETHFENENMFLEKWKLINPFFLELVVRHLWLSPNGLDEKDVTSVVK